MERKKAVYSIPEACLEYGVGRSTLYKEIQGGRLRAKKIGRRTVLTHRDLNAWLDELPDSHSVGKRSLPRLKQRRA
jgi:excisionase family DNA binding protein